MNSKGFPGKMASDTTNRLGARLVQAGLLTPEQLERALAYQQEVGGRLGDCLIEGGFLGEKDLLRFLAAEFKTRYVSTEKLAKVKIPSAILDKVPVKMAETALVLPILWDEARGVLSVVMAEPQNTALLEEVRIVSGARAVQSYIGTKSAVLAAVKKHYFGDISAFSDLQWTKQSRSDVRRLSEFYEGGGDSGSLSELRVPTESNPRINPNTGVVAPTSVREALASVRSASLTSDNDFIETLNVLVGLIELEHPGFKGHSAAVAKLVRSVSRRMGLSEREVNFNIIASYLHDIGKRHDRHIVLPRIAEEEGFRRDAKRYFRAPGRLFESVHLPVEVNAILGQLYEAWDASGVPDGRKGNEIALGARIIAAVDAYEDFIRVPRPGRSEPMERDEALAELEAYAGTLLDPTVVELVKKILTGDLMRQRLLADGQHILVVDPDPENVSLLELKLTQRGYVVSSARDVDRALELAPEADLVISETELPGETGFALLTELRNRGLDVPLIFVTADARSESVEHGLALGADDYVVKPYAVEVFLAKVKRCLDTRAAARSSGKAIHGNLDEMPLHDILMVLAEADRTGQLMVRGRSRTGEIFVENGRVVNAVFDDVRGEKALEALLSIASGTFVFTPDIPVLERTLDLGPDDIAGRLRQAAH
ncbi:MAG: response regulator [Deltaproteobacteria bacterium]|nr:MAG: response regulator [Deltaproteobacteria bacterium]